MKRTVLPALLALLCFPTCASLPPLTPPDGTSVAGVVPPFPRWAPTTRGPVPVRLVHHLICNAEPAFGCYRYATRSIEIEDTLSLVRRWRYLRHELVHAALDAAGVTFDNRDAENAVAEAVAEQQTTEMLMRWPR